MDGSLMPENVESWREAALLGRDRSFIPPPSPGLNKGLVLLDRDGTLNRLRPGYVTDPQNLDVLQGAPEAVRQLNDLGARVVLVTNQRGLARGLLSEAQLVDVHRSLLTELARAGAGLDGIHVCGHEEGECECRKPLPGLIYQVLERAPWADLRDVVLVGDSLGDKGAASNAGIEFVKIEDSQIGLAQKIEKVLALCAHFY